MYMYHLLQFETGILFDQEYVKFSKSTSKKEKKEEYPPAFRKDVTKCDLKEDCLKRLILAIIFKACEM